VILPALAAVLVAAAALGVATTAPVPAPEPGCALDDDRLVELSGLAVDAAGLWAISDDGRRVELYRLDPGDCAVLDTRTARIDPRDSEDLALGPDGALWVGDIGDNDLERDTVAVMVVPAAGPARLHRLRYPDGPHNAEALLVDATGAPVVVTKDPLRAASIYRTDGSPTGPGPTPLVRVGELVLPGSDTPGGPVGRLGSRVVTGAALSTDRRVVAVRTYTDAWLYPVPDGDVVAALARPVGPPVQVPLPGEPQGEAITFLPDGTLLSGSETRGGEVGRLRPVPGAARLVGVGAPPAPPAGAAARADGPAPAGWLPAAVGAAGVAGVVLLLGGLLAARRR